MARFQTETGWKRELAIRHRLSQQSDRTEKPAQPPHLDILPEERYCHLECLLKSKASESNCFRAPSICLILRTLQLGPMHGHAIAKAIGFRSDDVLQVEQGSLYPALHRLIKRRWISFEEGTSENNRRAKFYHLTAKGRRQLAVETGKWDKLARAIAQVLRPMNPEEP